MGLDATVYCNCIETGKWHTPHPYPHLLAIYEDGMPYINSENENLVEAHDHWIWNTPCKHKECVLLHHRLGNIALISLLRRVVASLSGDPEIAFPVLWSKVIYCRTHCGDHLEMDEVHHLQREIDKLQVLEKSKLKKKEAEFLKDFVQQLQELIHASLMVNKPISF